MHRYNALPNRLRRFHGPGIENCIQYTTYLPTIKHLNCNELNPISRAYIIFELINVFKSLNALNSMRSHFSKPIENSPCCQILGPCQRIEFPINNVFVERTRLMIAKLAIVCRWKTKLYVKQN